MTAPTPAHARLIAGDLVRVLLYGPGGLLAFQHAAVYRELGLLTGD